MRKFLLLLALASVGALASVTAAQAQVTSNVVVQVPFDIFVPCANVGAGEDIVGTLNFHVVTSSTINGNHVSGMSHINVPDTVLVGSVTGDTYRGGGMADDVFSGSLQNGQFSETAQDQAHFLGPGPDNNLIVSETAHITINANGDTTVFFDNFSVDCR
jgi:hypothetical protein